MTGYEQTRGAIFGHLQEFSQRLEAGRIQRIRGAGPVEAQALRIVRTMEEPLQRKGIESRGNFRFPVTE